MYTRTILATLLATSLFHSPGFAQNSAAKGIAKLPSVATQNAIRSLPSKKRKDSTQAVKKITQTDIQKADIKQYNVTAEKIPDASKGQLQFNSQGQASVPIAAPDTVILQFEPETSQAEIEAFLEERNLEIVQKYPKIGAIQAKGDLSSYFKPKLTDNSANDALLRGLLRVVNDFKSDRRIRNATPDMILRDQDNHSSNQVQITNLLEPTEVVLSDPTFAVETTDWGIADIEADHLWPMPGADDGVLFGVMDVGFARHEDLVFLELPSDTDVDDHGNHVAAIACGVHDNEVGIKGVLQNCFVRARSGDVFFNSTEGGDVLNFFVLFSQILATLENFVDSQDDVQTFNVSLGYNWRSNFGINPDLPDSSQWRALVESQGAFLVSLLELANTNGRVIFSAAGNDSTGLDTPISAKYASPFNWAAITAREEGIAFNGVIVEAHDENGNRASFSNTGGHISCPGVNIFSAVAHSPSGEVSRNAYGSMSGTSMASPYCASGQSLFKLVRPGYSGVEAVECMLQSSALSSSNTPMLRLQQALSACPARP